MLLAAVAIAVAALALGADSGAESHAAEIERLQAEMREAAQDLEFERAAELRDQIRELGGEPDREVLAGAGADVAAAPPREVKWGPHLDIGGKFGNERLLGRGDLFIPFWQDPQSLAFLDVRAMGDDNDTIEGNFGLGFRRMLNETVILGGYGFFDLRSSDRGGDRNEFINGTVGIEALTEDFDFRVNGYIPEDDTKNAPNKTKASLSGGSLFVKRGRERALYGVDGEIGVRVPLLPDALWDTRIYAGGFHFDAPKFDNVSGPRGRAEMRLYDLPLLPANSRLTLTGEVSHDDVREVVAFGGVKVRIPFYDFFWNAGHGSSPQGGLTRLERRMVDPVVREVDIVTNAEAIDEEPAVNPKTGNRIGPVRFADAAGGGDGTDLDSPDELPDAIAGAGTDGVVVVDAGTGDVIANVGLLDGQSLLGGGGSLPVVGAKSGTRAVWQPPGSRPTLIDGLDDGSPILMLATHNLVGGVDIDGMGNNTDGIRGTNFGQFMLMDTEIRDTDISLELDVDDGAVASYQGIDNRFLSNGEGLNIDVFGGGRLVAHVERGLFQDNEDDGLDVDVDDTGSMVDLTVYHSRFLTNQDDGIDLQQNPGSTLYFSMHSSVVQGNDENGLEVVTEADDEAGSIDFRGELVGNRFVGNGAAGPADGVLHMISFDGDVQVALDATWDVRENEFEGNSEDGFDLEVDGSVDDGSAGVTLWTDFVGNRFFQNGNDGLDFDVDTDNDDGTMSVTWGARVAGNEFVENSQTDFGADDAGGFSASFSSDEMTTVNLDWTFEDNLFRANGTPAAGAHGASIMVDTIDDFSVVSGSVSFVGNRFLNNQRDGLHVDLSDVGSDSTLQLDLDVIDNRFVGNQDAVELNVSDGAFGSFRFIGNRIDVPTDDGFDLDIDSDDGGSTVVLGGNEVAGAGGVALEIDADDTVFSSQVDGAILDNTFVGSAGAGPDCAGECDFTGSAGNTGTVRVNGVDEAVVD